MQIHEIKLNEENFEPRIFKSYFNAKFGDEKSLASYSMIISMTSIADAKHHPK